MTKTSWIVLGAVLAALLIYLMTGTSSPPTSSSSSKRASHPTSKASSQKGGKERLAVPARATQDELSQTQLPTAQDSVPTSAQRASQAAPVVRQGDHAEPVIREYVMADGTKMRDHRANPSKPRLDGYVVVPDSVSDVRPDTLVKVRTQLRPAMRECIRLNVENAEEGAKMQALLKVSIASEQLRVDDLRLTISGLENDDALRSCVTALVLGHEQEVPGAIDVLMHHMVFPYKL